MASNVFVVAGWLSVQFVASGEMDYGAGIADRPHFHWQKQRFKACAFRLEGISHSEAVAPCQLSRLGEKLGTD